MESLKQLLLVSEIASLSSWQVPEVAGERLSCLITSPLIGVIAHQTPQPKCIQEGSSTASVA
jgi:hypothetical protein